jgi:hypothetical protein
MRLKIFGVLAALSLLSISCGGSSGKARAAGFSVASLKGSYAGIFSGNIYTGTEHLPFLGTGIFIADGAGNLTGHETYTVVTTPCDATIKGTYTVEADGSGTNAVTFTTTSPGCTSGTYTQSLAISQSNELVLLSNTNGDQINEQWHLQN